jgi:hypothetical protein
VADLTRCTVCNRRAELNEYGECPICETSIDNTLLGEGIRVRLVPTDPDDFRDHDFNDPEPRQIHKGSRKSHGRRAS